MILYGPRRVPEWMLMAREDTAKTDRPTKEMALKDRNTGLPILIGAPARVGVHHMSPAATVPEDPCGGPPSGGVMDGNGRRALFI